MAEADPRGDIRNFDKIARAIRGGFCIPFLGAGASMAYRDWRNGQREIPGCPNAWELKDLLRGTLDEEEQRELEKVQLSDLPAVAEFCRYVAGGHRRDMEELVRLALLRAAVPRPIHWAIAGIPAIRCMITTNYDELTEDAARGVAIPCPNPVPPGQALPRRLLGPYVYDQSKTEQITPDSDAAAILQTQSKFDPAKMPNGGYPLILYKMHGCVRHPGSMLITTYDYVQFMASWKDERLGIPRDFRDLLTKSTFLFLGYGLGDWNFRVIWEAMIASFPNGRFNIKSYAIKTPVSEYERDLFDGRGIQLIDCDLTKFAHALALEFGVDVPAAPAPPPAPYAGAGATPGGPS